MNRDEYRQARREFDKLMREGKVEQWVIIIERSHNKRSRSHNKGEPSELHVIGSFATYEEAKDHIKIPITQWKVRIARVERFSEIEETEL